MAVTAALAKVELLAEHLTFALSIAFVGQEHNVFAAQRRAARTKTAPRVL